MTEGKPLEYAFLMGTYHKLKREGKLEGINLYQMNSPSMHGHNTVLIYAGLTIDDVRGQVSREALVLQHDVEEETTLLNSLVPAGEWENVLERICMDQVNLEIWRISLEDASKKVLPLRMGHVYFSQVKD